ncbi:hypothetical protein V1511DRAFT_318576 [Dipodascopsis uninucleata]
MKNDLEQIRVEILRNEIAQKSLELQGLLGLAKVFPKYKDDILKIKLIGGERRSISPTESSISQDSSRRSSSDFDEDRDSRYSLTSEQHRSSLSTISSGTAMTFISNVTSGSPGDSTTATNITASTPSSKVIESLQATIDSLKRELSVQTERSKEEKRQRNAVQRKLEVFIEQYNSMRHQNDMFDSILKRKENKVKDLERVMQNEADRRHIIESEMKTLNDRIVTLELEAAREKEARIHVESSYEVLALSNRQSLLRFAEQMRTLRAELDRIVLERQGDIEIIRALEHKYTVMAETKNNLLKLHHASETIRNQQLEAIQTVLNDLQFRVESTKSSDSDLLGEVNEELQRLRWIARNSSDETVNSCDTSSSSVINTQSTSPNTSAGEIDDRSVGISDAGAIKQS